MFEKFIGSGNISLLLNSIESGDSCSVFGLNTGEKLALANRSAKLFYVVENLDNVNTIYESLTALGRTCEVLTDVINIYSSEFTNYTKTISILSKLKSDEIDTLIITPEILCAKFPNKTQINEMELRVNDEVDVSKFIKKLIEFNYKKVDLVVGAGEFTVRGDVIDIYPLIGAPTRLYFDYDILQAIKHYNPVTMLTTDEQKTIKILSNKYYFVDDKIMQDKYAENKCKLDQMYFDFLEQKKLDFKLLAFDENINSSIFDYMPDALICFDGARAIYNAIDSALNEYNANLKNMPKIISFLPLGKKQNISEILRFNPSNSLLAFHNITESNRLFSPRKAFSIRTLPSVNYSSHDSALVLDIQNFIKQNYTIILCAGSEENLLKISKIFDKNNIQYFEHSRVAESHLKSVNIVKKNYPLDIIFPEEKLAIISTTSLFGKKKKIAEIDTGFFDGETPKAGDFVVHNFHGVGKCLGVETLKISDGFRDYVIVEYKNNDKLYLPVENLDQLTKFVGESSPTLNKIGGVEFEKTKTKIKGSIKKIAFDLVALYRDRMNLKGYSYPQDDQMQVEFEKNFGFDETLDQLNAINDCKSDMEAGKVMDRLICGDVGFGKTEVALRIAFKTILAGKQVALMCPTTILSEQHFGVAVKRMSDFGIKVEVLNRLKTKSEVDRIKNDISSGKVDFIIGTHKLLAKDIIYKNLGLLILDEEQKFGVADKEKIKNFSKSINVLTLSATPIPRTLNMSLIGVRDISVIETPPVQRQPSIVRVVELSDELVKSAIDREIARGGQVLIVYNRVEHIYNFASKIKALIPDAVVSVAHGQMNESELEKEIFNLYSGKTQVLVSTTLIENGVDLPNANTLIVINSDKLGLSQLYQLKGRVGRGDKTAYAFFTYNKSIEMTETAYKRLEAIEEFAEMGNGFKIAMRDLEIRGAGSLLGLEQSGHIEKLGYNMYVKLLNDSVKEIKGEKIDREFDVKIETNMSAYLSREYVASTSSRMKLYKDIANLQTLESLVHFIKNTESVYGTAPEELISLCKIALIKNLCSKIGGVRVIIKSLSKIFLSSKEDLTKDIIDTINLYPDKISLNLSSMPVIEINEISEKNRLDFIINFLQMVKNC